MFSTTRRNILTKMVCVRTSAYSIWFAISHSVRTRAASNSMVAKRYTDTVSEGRIVLTCSMWNNITSRHFATKARTAVAMVNLVIKSPESARTVTANCKITRSAAPACSR